MVIKLVRTTTDVPPQPDEPADLLWKAEHGGEASANASQLPASILSELMPSFIVGHWYSLKDAEELASTSKADPEANVWTEVPILSSADVPGLVSIQVRMGAAAKAMFEGAVDFAQRMRAEGAIWIRVE